MFTIAGRPGRTTATVLLRGEEKERKNHIDLLEGPGYGSPNKALSGKQGLLKWEEQSLGLLSNSRDQPCAFQILLLIEVVILRS